MLAPYRTAGDDDRNIEIAPETREEFGAVVIRRTNEGDAAVAGCVMRFRREKAVWWWKVSGVETIPQACWILMTLPAPCAV